MTFCTSCAAPIAPTADTCPSCGLPARSVAAPTQAPLSREAPRRSVLLRLLYVAPVLLIFAIAGAFVQRQTVQQQWLASAYASAENAAASGDYVSAREGFTAIAGFRDAADRAEEMNDRLAPLEAGYTDGLQAIERGDYAEAVEHLAPVAEQAPGLKDVVLRLEDARRLLGETLRREVVAAETVHDWPAAEQTLRELISLAPDDAEARFRLAALQREHGPVLLGKNRALWLVAPDGSDPRQLTDELHVIWPVWSPDRSRIAFFAPDPEDPMGNVALYTVGIDGANPQRLVDGVSAHAAPAWSPDGTRIAYTSFAGYDPVYESGSIGVRVIDVATGEETDLTGDEYPLAFNPSWSPDGSEIAFIVKHQGLGERPQHAPGDVLVVRIGADGFENVTNGAVRDVWSVSWSPAGDSLLLYSLFGQTWYEPPSTSIRVFDRASGEIEQVARIEEQPTTPVWAPDGVHYAYTIDEKTIVIGDVAGERETIDAAEALSGEATWSPDGTMLVLAPWDAGTSSTVVDLSGAEPVVTTVRFEFDASPPFISPPQWAPAVPIPPAANPSLPLPSAATASTA
jgi:Tol biopolymer transport system component